MLKKFLLSILEPNESTNNAFRNLNNNLKNICILGIGFFGSAFATFVMYLLVAGITHSEIMIPGNMVKLLFAISYWGCFISTVIFSFIMINESD